MKPHKIHSARFSANQEKVTIYTSCGRIQITVDKDITLGIKVHVRPHKTKTISYDSWDNTYLKPKPRYKQVRTTRRLDTK